MSAPVAGLVAGLAVLLWLRGPTRRLPGSRRAVDDRHGRPVPAGSAQPRARARRSARRSWLVATVAGAGVGLLVGGAAGVGAGGVALVTTGLVLGRLEPGSLRARREALVRQAPLAVDLVAACLASGAGLEPSVLAAAHALGPPVADELHPVLAALRLGAEPEQAWAGVDASLAELGRAAVRSSRTGAPLADLLPRAAEQARSAHRARSESRVRTASVRLTAPLGAAFLPAFVLLGVVPVVAAWLGVLL